MAIKICSISLTMIKGSFFFFKTKITPFALDQDHIYLPEEQKDLRLLKVQD
jgi:hypothetical protein